MIVVCKHKTIVMFSKALTALLVLALYLGDVKGEICAGCPVQFDPTTEDVGKWVIGTLNSVNADPLHLIRISHATKQVVNGVKYTLDAVTTVPGNANGIQNCKLVYLWQPWITKEPQLLSENCTSALNEIKTGRQLLGGLKNVEPSEMGTVQELANYAVKTLDNIDTDDSRRIVAEVVDAKKQLVNGIMYHLQLRVKTTSCIEEDSNSNDCINKEVEPEKFCKIQVHRSWADKSPLNAKVVKSECEALQGAILGGLVELNTNGDDVQKLAEMAIERYNMMTNCMTMSGLIGILKASSQAVAGNNVYLTIEIGDTDCQKNQYTNGKLCNVIPNNSDKHTICDVVVWQKPWENFQKITSLECKTEYYRPGISTNGQNRMKRDVMTGGPVKMDLNDAYTKDLVQYAVADISRTTNSVYGYHKVLGATSQVVAGVKVTITMEMGPSDCQTSNTQCKICKVVIWDRPWLNDRKVLESSCESKREKRAFVGGQTEKNVNSPEILKYKNFVGLEATSRLNSDRTKAVVKILKATKQVVSGSITRLTVVLGDTDCLSTENKDPSDCTIIPSNGPAEVCEVAIWEQSWLKRKEVTEFKCSQERQKRGAPGAPYDVDVDSEDVKELSKFFLTEMDKTTNSNYRLGLHHIIRATNQVVSGTKTTIKMAIGDSSCRKGEVTNSPCNANSVSKVCTVVIWDQPWLNHREIMNSFCENSRAKRQALGGRTPLNVDDEAVVSLKPLVASRISQQTNSIYIKGIVRVISASKQVVSGTLIRMTVEVGDTDCLKTQANDVSSCQIVPSNSGNHEICEVTVWEQAWLNRREVKESNCRNVHERKSGGIEPVDVNNPNIVALKGFAAQEITNRANSLYTKAIVRVVDARTQIVSGILTRMTVEVADTDCLKTENKNPSQCNIVSTNSEEYQICHITIWEQAWLNKKEVTKCDCYNKNKAV